jgi:hypothetical protein
MIVWESILYLFILFGIPLILIAAYLIHSERATMKAWEEFAKRTGLVFFQDRKMVAGVYMGHGADLSYFNPYYHYDKEGIAGVLERFIGKRENSNMNWTKITVHLNAPFKGFLRIKTRRAYHSVTAKVSGTEVKLQDPNFDPYYYISCSDPYLPIRALQPATRVRFFRVKGWVFYWEQGKGHAMIPGKFRNVDELMEAFWIVCEVVNGIDAVAMGQ